MISLSIKMAGVAVALLALTACETVSPTINAAGRSTTYQDPATRGVVSGIGIESQDIVSMTDKMMRDMLTSQRLMEHKKKPRVIVDSGYFKNESSSRLNINSITNRLRVGLNRSAKGRLVFVGRQSIDMVAKERDLKRSGKVDSGTTGLTRAVFGADYRLRGSVTSLDARSRTTGLMSRYSQITFELIDLESSEVVWSGIYEFQKTAADDILYR